MTNMKPEQNEQERQLEIAINKSKISFMEFYSNHYGDLTYDAMKSIYESFDNSYVAHSADEMIEYLYTDECDSRSDFIELIQKLTSIDTRKIDNDVRTRTNNLLQSGSSRNVLEDVNTIKQYILYTDERILYLGSELKDADGMSTDTWLFIGTID